MGEVVNIDKAAKQLTISNGDKISYDFLIVATGARHSYFGNDRWEAFAPGLKTINDALKIREQILISFEKAERLDSILEASKYLNFVIIGGGPTGVELAGKIIEIARTNTNAAFEHAQQLLGVKSPSEFIELSTAHARKQFDTMIAQTKELTELGQKVTTKITEPLKAGVTMAFNKKVV